jgi:hypothetical protein
MPEFYNGKLQTITILIDLIYNVEFKGSAYESLQMPINRSFRQIKKHFLWIGLLHNASWAIPQESPILSTLPNDSL